MEKMENLLEALDSYKSYLAGTGGERADLRGADLRGADLRGADLRGANLHEANLRGADLRGADLRGANLHEANLHEANLHEADLRGANLHEANLRGANLHKADLPAFQIVPEEGVFIAWKRAGRAVLKLRVPSSAKRVSSLIGRKCRVSEAKVVLAFVDGEEQRGGGAFVSERGGKYVVGETTKSDSFDDDIRVDCTNGIHVFVTRAEAESW